MQIEELQKIPLVWDKLSNDEKKAVLAHLEAIEEELMEWHPLPGAQTMAFENEADIILYGGAAGGGKSDLALGKALKQHKRTLILRREFPQLAGLLDRANSIYARHGKFTGTPKPVWRLKYKGLEKTIELDSCQYDDDKNKFQGRPHDLRVIDEAANFLESQVDFLAGWVRSEDPRQKCQLLLVSNPPTTAEGRWLIRWFAPWVDPKHPNPAKPGELRWFAKINNIDTEVESKEQFIIVDKKPCYDFDPKTIPLDEIITPKSRTFIPARVVDNPYYVKSGYIATLQALPEPLRSQMLKGDFLAGSEDAAWQVIPTEWVLLAQKRWRTSAKPFIHMSTLGVDVARGGRDKTVITARFDNWFDVQKVFPGQSTPDGNVVAALVLKERFHECPVVVDIIGVGASVYDALRAGIRDPEKKELIVGFNASHTSSARDRSGQLTFYNKRAEWYWKLREALDPQHGLDLALPDDPELLQDLCTPLWEYTQARGIKIESKEEIISRIGRSPDKADSLIYAFVSQYRQPVKSATIPWMAK
jgi:hypothetical protein